MVDSGGAGLAGHLAAFVLTGGLGCDKLREMDTNKRDITTIVEQLMLSHPMLVPWVREHRRISIGLLRRRILISKEGAEAIIAALIRDRIIDQREGDSWRVRYGRPPAKERWLPPPAGLSAAHYKHFQGG